MPELTFLLLRLGFLVVLWVFVLLVVRAIRLDVFGPKVTRVREARPARAAATPKPVAAPKAPRTKERARQLVVTEGELTGTTIELDNTVVTIGRDPASTLVISDSYISNHHAQLVPNGTAWVLEDLGSTNGTFIGKTKVTKPRPLPIGTSVRIGTTSLELRP